MDGADRGAAEPPARLRLDRRLSAEGFYESREQAQAAIIAGEVRVDGLVVDKPSRLVSTAAHLEVSGPPRFVGRGGEKLAGALDDLGLSPAGCVALDAGAGRGGFTDCLLQRGARHVVAVDVGHGQFARRLPRDGRVTLIEGQNLRSLTREVLRPSLPPGLPWPDLAVLDLSFIGLAKVFPAVRDLLQPCSNVLALVKPQFEVGRERLGKGGVVRNPELHASAIMGVADAAWREGFALLGLVFSRLRGPEGNLEYFLLLRTPAAQAGPCAPGGEDGQLEKTGRPQLDRQTLRESAARVVQSAAKVLGARSR